MRNRSLRSTATVAAGLALLLSSCTTSEDPTPTPTATEDAAATSDDGLEGTEGRNGWLCEYVNASAVNAAAGGEAVTPRQRIVEDDEDAWVCEVLSGGPGEQEPIIRLSILLGEQARAEARERAEAAEGVEPGPEHLGRSYISPGLVTGLTSCVRPGATQRDDQVPHTLIGESFLVDDQEVTEDLRGALSSMAQGLDKGLGCSPKQAVIDQADSDGDDAGTTTAP